MSQKYQDPFVTVVSVGIEDKTQQCTPKKAVNNSEYITVLTIGNEETKTIKDVTEEVIVYRLPGERLGFGLKFEGGTKAHEFVKRLFIQSCAPDSPASRVQSSWGQLVEGDEVFEIDSIPVNSMTRIDCVRFLKDSNVAIKLLVKHCFNTTPLKQRSKSSEDLPVIISTEEKKPPPVPPRKLHRKIHKLLQNNVDNVHDNIVPTIKQQETFSGKSTRLQSPRNSFRKKYSPDVCRRLSDGSLGPPDAEVYLDLISQESTYSLSESDDTGSTISTVLDRFASFPTTTTSSFAGSLPSTPTSIQKHLDLSYIINDFPEEDFLPLFEKKFSRSGLVEENNNIVNGIEEDNVKCLQDMELLHSRDQIDYPPREKESTTSPQTPKRPVITPRSRDKINKQISQDNENTLPRLVDFVPKTPQKELDASMDTLKRFLENERFDFEYVETENVQADDMNYNMDPYGSKWLLSSHLSTIGEDEEEHSGHDFSNNFGSSCYTPRVTIETADCHNTEGIPCTNSFPEEIRNDNPVPMEIPPSDSRQPPDGHEFPDFVETSSKITLFIDTKYNPGHNNIECATNFKSSWSDMDQPNITTLDRSISSSNCDLRLKINDSDEEKYETYETSNLLHTRSQSLIDMSIYSKEKSSNKWNTLAEQRKRRLSKLKGLVIPEAAENDITPLVNIPEIKSINTSQIDLVIKPEATRNGSVTSIINTAPLVLPSWSSNTMLPKYSPAFKRKTLQVYPVGNAKRSDSSDAESSYDEYISKYSDSTPSRTTDDPRSLESIASPTRSDCSFDYTSSKTIPIKDHHLNNTKDFGDSDNDSAVSSSQSSYNSRGSPPPSPSSDDKLNGPNRMLKPFSVEAINRKNILASAKCRSGKDLKIGSPVIQRKTSREEEATDDTKIEEVPSDGATPIILGEEQNYQNEVTEVSNSEATEVSSSEVVVLHEAQNSHSPVLVNEPVTLEVYVERTTAIVPKVEEKIEEKPIPTKRTMPPPVAASLKDNKTDLGENRLSSLLGRNSASSILERRNKPVNIQSLRANFENSNNNSMPVFPKSYKTDNKVSPVRTPPELANCKPVVTTRRRSEEFLIKARRKSDDKLLFRQISQEEMPKLDTRRLSNSSLTKEEPVRNPRISTKKDEVVVRRPSADKETSVASPSIEFKTVDLSLEQVGGSLGITLAGGADYENKNITIHRIRYGSVAYQDGRLQKGDKIVSINDQQVAGLTHSTATELLKKPYTKFTIVIEESRDIVPSSSLSRKSTSSVSSLISSETKALVTDSPSTLEVKNPTQTVTLIKDGAGLGFSIEGGKDSPKGDVPLLVKKIFTGGAADKCGELNVGDQILSVNAINFQNLSRIDAWSQMKKIPEGTVKIEIFR